MDYMTQNAAFADKVSAAAQEMQSQASSLAGLVGQIRPSSVGRKTDMQTRPGCSNPSLRMNAVC